MAVVLLLIWAKAGATMSRILKYPMLCLFLNSDLTPTALYCQDKDEELPGICSDKRRIRDHYDFTKTYVSYLVLYDVLLFIF